MGRDLGTDHAFFGTIPDTDAPDEEVLEMEGLI